MDMSDFESDQVVFGRYTEKEIESRVGGKSAGKKYLNSLNPFAALPKIKVPSFHYYVRNIRRDELLDEGGRAEEYFAKAGQPNVFLKGMPMTTSVTEFLDNRDQKVREESIRVHSELLKFLDQHLVARK